MFTETENPTNVSGLPVDLLRNLANRILTFLFILTAILVSVSTIFSQAEFEGRQISELTIAFEGTGNETLSGEQFRIIARNALGETYSTVKVRDALSVLYETNEISTIKVEGTPDGNAVAVRFLIRRKTVAKQVQIVINSDERNAITEQELLLRLNLLDPGTRINERSLQNNANLIVEYLRERGYFRAEALAEQRPLSNDSEVAITFRVTPGPQATVESFDIAITGAQREIIRQKLKLLPGEIFTRAKLNTDIDRIRDNLRREGFLAPTLREPRVIYDSETNKIGISLVGEAGPTVEIVVDSERSKIGTGTQTRLLPIRREGTLDYAAIIEGERRLENYYQERGYFFVDVVSVCSVAPSLTLDDATPVPNETGALCSMLNNAELLGKGVEVKYRVDLGRRLTLVDIRLEGTDQFMIDEINAVLESKEANILGIIPLFGYGRGYTSARILEQDAATIRSLLRELGYREATVRVNQGVSIDGENLIITFVVDQGEPTVISEIAITGNSAFTDAELLAELPDIEGKNFSRARLRNGQRKLAEFYSQAGYFDAAIDFSIDELPADPDTDEKRFRILYTVRNEGVPVYIDRILVSGNERTKTQAIVRALALEPNELLRSGDIYTSEQNLYASSAFERVTIRQQPSGDKPDGSRGTDLIVDVLEQKPILLQYGGGYSTALGLSGFADVRHFNLLGNLWQGGANIRWSQRQQIIGLDFVNPRFIRDGAKRFAPLTISAQYQRDSTITRFFRSAFDRGTFGIVQRVDEDGNPIDEFGAETGSPTLNRLTLTAETNRTISRRDRSILFFRYRFESVRLLNIESLLLRDLLRPDSRIRISGFGTTFVRDTRKRCNIEYTILEIIDRGEPGEPCRYSASDPTNGDFLTAEYNVSVPALGANIGFHKFQGQYTYYHTFTKLLNTTIAARGILGMARVFSRRNIDASSGVPDIESTLPISERFFAGGGNTLRGFEFESAGPRVAIVPEGIFRNSDGEPVTLNPFTVPFGGNALAVVNIEARIPLNKLIRAVPFYDGGNVFRRVSDIFKPPTVPPDDLVRRNLRAVWTHTVGFGLRVQTPIGGEFGVDYGYLLNRPTYFIPQGPNPPLIFQPPRGQIHFRFSQAF